MNPYYLAYCEAHGRTPDEMKAHDRKRFPGGCMADYMIWNQNKWSEFAKAHGMSRLELRSMINLPERFVAWLRTGQLLA